jgi:hypothetical protein
LFRGARQTTSRRRRSSLRSRAPFPSPPASGRKEPVLATDPTDILSVSHIINSDADPRFANIQIAALIALLTSLSEEVN